MDDQAWSCARRRSVRKYAERLHQIPELRIALSLAAGDRVCRGRRVSHLYSLSTDRNGDIPPGSEPSITSAAEGARGDARRTHRVSCIESTGYHQAVSRA